MTIKNIQVMIDYNNFLNEALKADLAVGMKVIFVNNVRNKLDYDRKLKVQGLTATLMSIYNRKSRYGYYYVNYYMFELDKAINGLKTIPLEATQLRAVEILDGKKNFDGLVKVTTTSDFRKILNAIKFKIQEKFLDITKLSYDINDPDFIYYIPANKLQYNDDKYKTKTRVGRVLSKLNPNLTQQEVEKFVNLFRAEVQAIKEPPKIEVVTGDAIAYWYNYKRYESGNGTLNNSCMRNSDAVQFYGQFPDKIALAIYVKNNNLWGRALIWNCDDGAIYMDRIYSVKPEAQIQIRNFGKKLGMEIYPDKLNKRSRRVTLKGGFKWAKSGRNYPYFDSATLPQDYWNINNKASKNTDLILYV